VTPVGVDPLEVALDVVELAVQLQRLAGELALVVRPQVVELASCVRHAADLEATLGNQRP
jgi:hypothetical protein